MASWKHAQEESQERTPERDTSTRQDRNGGATHREVGTQGVREPVNESKAGLLSVGLNGAKTLFRRVDFEIRFEGGIPKHNIIPKKGTPSAEPSCQAAI